MLEARAWLPQPPNTSTSLLLCSVQVLVDILKQDWPHKWPSFIPDIVGASRTNETLCENSMAILRLLSEEVFDFSKDSLTMVGWLVESMEVGWRMRSCLGICWEVGRMLVC